MFKYPPIDKHGQPMPTDSNFRPIHAVVDEDGNEFKRDQEGKSVDEFGRPLPTDAYGQPVRISNHRNNRNLCNF